MASPQAENGHVDIANSIIEALARHKISPNEWQVLMVIFRKTYGWHKKEDGIPLSQFCEMTGILKPHVHRALKKLAQRNVITRTGNVTRIGNDYIVNYQFQKDYDKWEALPKLVTRYLNRQRGVTRTGNGALPKLVTSKETTKENTKERYPQDFLLFYNSYPNRKEKEETFRRWKKLGKKKPPVEVIIEAIKRQIKWRENARGAFRPEWKHPATWLNRGCWEDEADTPTTHDDEYEVIRHGKPN